MTGTHIVAIVGIVFWGAFCIAKLFAKNKTQAESNKEMDEFKDALAQELKEVKERLVVLEKIVTDEKYDLKKKINGL